MHLRHRVPTIFNIYMLDVICCALGCVVLLWQVAHQEAEQQTEDASKQSAAAQKARQQFEQAQKDLRSKSSDVTDLQATVADWHQRYLHLAQSLAMTEKEREEARKLAAARQDAIDKTRKSLALSQEELKKFEDDLAKLLADNKKTVADLTGTQKINVDLLAQLALLKSDIASRQLDIDKAAKKSQEQTVLLKLSAENAGKLQKLLDSMRDETKDTQAKLKLTELQLKVREQDLERSRKELLELLASKDKQGKALVANVKDLDEAKRLIASLTAERDLWKEKLAGANLTVGSLTTDKTKLTQRITDLQTQAEQRFAGIPLTGESVVFLIDISGSMILMDENTEDPEKWPFLCETLMKLMQSIPTLQRFQVILFSDKVSYLFGNRDFWLKYEGPKTALATRDALRKVKVEGGTNMHDAFAEAFRFRKLKLDTIYLFSDGLPNLGEGMPASIKNPTEAQRNYHLSKFIRDKLKDDWNRPAAGLKDVRINAVGFFFESPDVGAFLWAMAREHKGSFVGLR